MFKVKMNEIKVKELPEADDDFAQDVSDFDTLEEYKADRWFSHFDFSLYLIPDSLLLLSLLILFSVFQFPYIPLILLLALQLL